jgi:hypothetical protein
MTMKKLATAALLLPGFSIATARAGEIGSDGHFYSSLPLDCADDTEAMKQAKQLVGGRG